MKTALNVGNIIKVHGFVMMKGFEDGKKYKVLRISNRFGKPVYWFSKPKGKKELFGHYAHEVDGMINPRNNNRIELILDDDVPDFKEITPISFGEYLTTYMAIHDFTITQFSIKLQLKQDELIEILDDEILPWDDESKFDNIINILQLDSNERMRVLDIIATQYILQTKSKESVLISGKCAFCRSYTETMIEHKKNKKRYSFCNDCYEKGYYNNTVFEFIDSK